MDDPFVKEKSNPKQFLVTKRQKKQAIKRSKPRAGDIHVTVTEHSIASESGL